MSEFNYYQENETLSNPYISLIPGAVTGTVNGSNLNFTLSFAPDPSAALSLWDGATLQVLGTDYTTSGTTLTFLAGHAPHIGLTCLAGHGQAAVTVFVTLDSVAAMRTLAGANAQSIYYLNTPGIQGSFYHDPNDTISLDNTGTVIVTNAGARLKRVYSSALNVRWFGAVGDGSTDDTLAFQNAAIAAITTDSGTISTDSAKPIYVPQSTSPYVVTAPGNNRGILTLYGELFGDGKNLSIIKWDGTKIIFGNGTGYAGFFLGSNAIVKDITINGDKEGVPGSFGGPTFVSKLLSALVMGGSSGRFFNGIATFGIGTSGSGGSGYKTGDIILVTGGGGTNATFFVNANATGAVTGLVPRTNGADYSIGTNRTTSVYLPGTGSGCTIDINSLFTAMPVNNILLQNMRLTGAPSKAAESFGILSDSASNVRYIDVEADNIMGSGLSFDGYYWGNDNQQTGYRGSNGQAIGVYCHDNMRMGITCYGAKDILIDGIFENNTERGINAEWTDNLSITGIARRNVQTGVGINGYCRKIRIGDYIGQYNGCGGTDEERAEFNLRQGSFDIPNPATGALECGITQDIEYNDVTLDPPYNMTFQSAPTGTFVVGDILTGGTSAASATVVTGGSTATIFVGSLNGSFSLGDTITGSISHATGIFQSNIRVPHITIQTYANKNTIGCAIPKLISLNSNNAENWEINLFNPSAAPNQITGGLRYPNIQKLPKIVLGDLSTWTATTNASVTAYTGITTVTLSGLTGGTFVPGEVVTGSVSLAAGIVNTGGGGTTTIELDTRTIGGAFITSDTITGSTSGAHRTFLNGISDGSIGTAPFTLSASTTQFSNIQASMPNIGQFICRVRYLLPTYGNWVILAQGNLNSSVLYNISPCTTRMVLGTVSLGPFLALETVTGGSSGATAVVVHFTGSELIVTSVNGTFTTSEIVTGAVSHANAPFVSIQFTDADNPDINVWQEAEFLINTLADTEAYVLQIRNQDQPTAAVPEKIVIDYIDLYPIEISAFENGINDYRNRIVTYGTAAPSSGTYNEGDFCWNTLSGSSLILGWSCTVGGAPGTWVAASIAPDRNQLVLATRGLIAENYQSAASTNTSIIVSGTVYFGLIGLIQGDVINDLSFVTGVASIGASTGCYAGIYDVQSNLLLASTANRTTDLDAVGIHSLPLSSTFTVSNTKAYYAVILVVNGGTPPALARGSNQAGSLSAPAGGTRLFATQTGQTTLPSTATPGTGIFSFWMGVS